MNYIYHDHHYSVLSREIFSAQYESHKLTAIFVSLQKQHSLVPGLQKLRLWKDEAQLPVKQHDKA
jgi:hypothetical protein